jgi:hypothetical protein
MAQLTVRDHMRLRFEEQTWRYRGAKDAAALELFSETPTTYYARLQPLLDRPEALVAYPMTVRRLLRLPAASGGPNCVLKRPLMP